MTGKQKCLGCGKTYEIKEFERIGTRKNSKKYNYNCSICHECSNQKQHERRCTFDGFITKILHDAKSSSKKRLAKNRINAGKFDLTKQQLIDLYEKQNGLCYYSNIQLSMKPCSDWMCSIERLNNNEGYTIDNIALVCHEFNCGTKWSKSKLQELLIKLTEYRNHGDILKEIDESLIIKRKSGYERKPLETKVKKNITYYKCGKCNEFKVKDDFTRVNDGCRICTKKISDIYHETIRGHLKSLLGHANDHTKNRQKVKQRQENKHDDVCTLTFEEMVDILKKQFGCCAYSGIKMNYGSYLNHNWVASLERIDSTKGYVKDNVCFVCLEFNTTDMRHKVKYSNGGSGHWTTKKFYYFLNSLFGQKINADKNITAEEKAIIDNPLVFKKVAKKQKIIEV